MIVTAKEINRMRALATKLHSQAANRAIGPSWALYLEDFVEKVAANEQHDVHVEHVGGRVVGA